MTGRAQPTISVPSWLRLLHRTWRPARRLALSALIALVIPAASCITKKEVEQAKASSYDADFAVVFGATVEAVRELYPNLTETPVKGTIATSWHQVHLSGDANDQNAQASSRGQMGPNPNNVFSGDSSAKRFFIRFDITVTGGRPWRIRLAGRAAQWDPGNAVPTELRGASRPPWLESRSDALLVAIHRRLKSHAIERAADAPDSSNADIGPRSDPKTFTGIPTAAAQELAGLRDEVLRRDWTRLRSRFASDVTWSLGAEPGLDAAMALWQADPTALDELQKTLDQGCAPSGADVLCPKAAATPGFAGYRLVLSQRSGAWKVISFLNGL